MDREFEAIPDDSRILQESSHLGGAITRDFTRIEVVISLAVILPLLENRRPAQARLRTLENQEFKQLAVTVDRNAPLPVMILPVKRAAVGSRPGAGGLPLTMLPKPDQLFLAPWSIHLRITSILLSARGG
jgi:hypothetical protein